MIGDGVLITMWGLGAITFLVATVYFLFLKGWEFAVWTLLAYLLLMGFRILHLSKGKE